MPKKFSIPNNGSLIVNLGEGYYNPAGKQGQEDFKVFFGDYFEAMLSNAEIGTKKNPTTVTAESYLTGGLDALKTTTAVVDLPKPDEITETKGQYVLRIKQESDPEIAYKNGKSLDAKWIKDGHQLIADTMTNAIKQNFPHVNTANIKIEILDWNGKNWFTTHPDASSYGTGETLFTLRFNANRWEKLWQGKEKEYASKIGETFKCIEEGRKQAQQEYQTEKEIYHYLDIAHSEKLKNLKKKHSQHYELKPEEFLLKNQTSYEFMCKVLHLPFDSFKQGFDQKSPEAADGTNAFKASNSAAGFYFFRQKQLTNNLTELKIAEGQDSPEKSRLSNALHIIFNENLLVKSVEAATMPNGNLIDAIQSARDPLQNHLVNLEVCVHQRLLNFSVSYKQDTGNLTIKNNNKSSASSSSSSSSSLPASENNNSNSSDESEIKDNALIEGFLHTYYALSKLTTSVPIQLPLPILKLFFEAISWHVKLLNNIASLKNFDEKLLELLIKDFCNAGILILKHTQKMISNDEELSKFIPKMIDFFENEIKKENLGTISKILEHINAITSLLASETAVAICKNNQDNAFASKSYIPSPKSIAKNDSTPATAKELFAKTQSKFKDMSNDFSKENMTIAYQALVCVTERFAAENLRTPTEKRSKTNQALLEMRTEFTKHFIIALDQIYVPPRFYNVPLTLKLLKSLVDWYCYVLYGLLAIINDNDTQEYSNYDLEFWKNVYTIANTTNLALKAKEPGTQQQLWVESMADFAKSYLEDSKDNKEFSQKTTFTSPKAAQNWYTKVTAKNASTADWDPHQKSNTSKEKETIAVQPEKEQQDSFDASVQAASLNIESLSRGSAKDSLEVLLCATHQFGLPHSRNPNYILPHYSDYPPLTSNNNFGSGSSSSHSSSQFSVEQEAKQLANNFEQTVLKLLSASFQQPRSLPLKFYLQHALLFVRWYRMAIRNTHVSQLESFDVLYIKNRQERFLHAINRVIAEASEQMPADRNMFIQFIETWNGLYNLRNKSSNEHSDRISKLIMISEDNDNKTLEKALEPTEEMLDDAIVAEAALRKLETQDLTVANAKDSSTKKSTPCNLKPLYNAITACAERFSNDAMSVLTAQKCKK